ncbi:radical SAM/SPASM domain-containing protein [Psychroserpens luteus]|uniref:Radical SAM/SPASM domain-containing protein n=1 Tax=Psychroserpens luteus TaxID=1434066 RepID=A0ABW5ZWK0_9FLAO|nr:radical SAM protein [Psychroserpens luteus]
MKYKLSHYLVFSEPIINQNYRLVYSTVSTTLTLLKIELYDKLIAGSFFDMDSSFLKKLISLNVIVEENFNELNHIIQENKTAISNEDMLYQVISPSANCQLGCDYCGQVHTKDLLDESLNLKILKRISNNLNLKEYKELHIGWFGAEPLMGLKNIRKLSVELMNLASTKSCSYSAKMVTNGLSLKKQIFFDLVEKYKVNKFEITLDGTEEHHDIRRHTKLKEKTFKLIFNNLKNIVNDERFDQSNCSITVRCNVDTSNFESTYALIDLLEKENILNKISFYTAPIHSWGNDAHLKSLTHEEYAKFQIDTFLELIEKKHPLSILPGAKTHIVCTSLYEHAEVFDAYGDVYNCTEISQVPAYEKEDLYKVGKLNDEEYINKNRPYSSWNDDILNGEIPCTDCRILPICGGACPKLWKEGISPCPPIKYNIEDRLLIEFSKNKDKYLQL